MNEIRTQKMFVTEYHLHFAGRELLPYRILLIFLFTLSTSQLSAYGQSNRPFALSSDLRPGAETSILRANRAPEPEVDLILARRAIGALKRLNDNVLIYRSLADFEANGRIARVSYEVFENNLREVIAEVEPIISQLSENKLKAELLNALYSYRDGGFWWGKTHQSRVVNVSTMTLAETTTASEAVFISTVPYTIAIHWRQASKYLERAEKLMSYKK